MDNVDNLVYKSIFPTKSCPSQCGKLSSNKSFVPESQREKPGKLVHFVKKGWRKKDGAKKWGKIIVDFCEN